MPNPIFEPIIGSGFDQIAGQRAGWAGFNRGVDEANLSRLAAAQQTRNNWLQQIQSLQQQQADRQYQADEQGQANMLAAAQRAQQEAEKKRQFDVSSGIKRLAITSQLDAAKQQQQEATTQAENYGTNTVDELASVGQKMERALSDKTDAQASLATKAAEWSAKVPQNKVVLNKTSTMFVQRQGASKLTDAEKSAVDAANSELENAYAKFKTADTDHLDASKTFNQMVAEASKMHGLSVRKNGDTWGFYHDKKNQWYLPKNQATKSSAPSFMPVMGGRAMADEASMQTVPAATAPAENNGFWNRFANPWVAGGSDTPAVAPPSIFPPPRTSTATTGVAPAELPVSSESANTVQAPTPPPIFPPSAEANPYGPNWDPNKDTHDYTKAPVGDYKPVYAPKQVPTDSGLTDAQAAWGKAAAEAINQRNQRSPSEPLVKYNPQFGPRGNFFANNAERISAMSDDQLKAALVQMGRPVPANLSRRALETRVADEAAVMGYYAPASNDVTSDAAQAAPADKAQRNVGQIYQTPKGPMKWAGDGWQTL